MCIFKFVCVIKIHNGVCVCVCKSMHVIKICVYAFISVCAKHRSVNFCKTPYNSEWSTRFSVFIQIHFATCHIFILAANV